MQKITKFEFGPDFYVYYKPIGFDNYEVVGFEHYQKNKDKFKGMELIIAHKNVPVYFRTA